MNINCSTCITNGIEVSVHSLYVPEQSSPATNSYVFAYRVTITNLSKDEVKLIARHWNIIDALSEKRVVQGEGVVGIQPNLLPGESHTYVSGTYFKTPAGKMDGWYLMENINSGDQFKVIIPTFAMYLPSLLN